MFLELCSKQGMNWCLYTQSAADFSGGTLSGLAYYRNDFAGVREGVPNCLGFSVVPMGIASRFFYTRAVCGVRGRFENKIVDGLA